jgi:bis(5'-nucleosidyl)-tetraphosphatase
MPGPLQSRRAAAERRALSAGVVVVRDAGSPRYLLLRAFAYWDFPKGSVELGETPIAAARREVAEETGIVDLDFRWGRAWRETPPYGRGKVARYYVAATGTSAVSLRVNPDIGRPEHHEYRWLGYASAAGLLVPRVAAILEWAHGLVTGHPRRS